VTPTALTSTVMVSSQRGAILAFFAEESNPGLNASVTALPDLQNVGNRLISIQGVDRIVLPADVSRLLPPSAVPAGAM